VKIVCVGGGPAGLYLALSAKLRNKDHEVTVVERNPAGVTYGWGVTFSDDLLDSLYRNDPDTGQQINDQPASWVNQEVRVPGRRPTPLGGYGYAIGRDRLLDILVRRAAALGVRLEFGREARELAEFPDADLVVVCDGANSRLREPYADEFGTNVHLTRNKYIWLGTHQIFDSFVFAFEKTAAGWVWFYAYRFNADTTTFIVECSSLTWTALGFDVLRPEESLKLLERIFRRHLDGHSLIGPPHSPGTVTPWLNFGYVTNRSWHHGNVVLLGDAAHTTHFSTGSGTTLAIQDAIALADKLQEHDELPAALEAYQVERRTALLPAQSAALNSTRWFENVHHHIGQEATRFAYDLWGRRGVYPLWRYQLYLATQIATLRRLRLSLSAARRQVRARRRVRQANTRQCFSRVNSTPG
jgi:anthraniloyl-CoA monooxygenase